MGMRRINAIRSDALSRDTAYTGLPKAIKFRATTNNSAPGAGTVALVFDEVTFNYGGYAPRLSGGGPKYNGVYIPEPGIYKITGQVGFVANSQTSAIYVFHNDVVNHRDGTINQFSIGNVHGNGAFIVCQQVTCVGEFKTGDTVSLWYTQLTGGDQVALTNYTWFYVEKLGGQY